MDSKYRFWKNVEQIAAKAKLKTNLTVLLDTGRVSGFTSLQGFTPLEIGEWEWSTPFLEWE